MSIGHEDFLAYPGHNESRRAEAVLLPAEEAANKWLAENPVRVLSVETLSEVEGGGVTSIIVRYKGLRVWYAVNE